MVDDQQIEQSSSVRDLGVHYNQHLSITLLFTLFRQIQNVLCTVWIMQMCFCWINPFKYDPTCEFRMSNWVSPPQKYRQNPSIPLLRCSKNIYMLVTSIIDYCNSLLLTRFNKIAIPNNKFQIQLIITIMQVDKEAIGLSRVQQFSHLCVARSY